VSATDIVGYTFQAENICPECIVKAVTGVGSEIIGFVVDIEGVLDIVAGALKINRHDENTFDSDDFPKVIFSSQIEEPEKCAKCKWGYIE
jgi:hypothetical protein